VNVTIKKREVKTKRKGVKSKVRILLFNRVYYETNATGKEIGVTAKRQLEDEGSSIQEME